MIRVGLVGAGRMGRAFLDAVQSSPDVRVAWVVDRAPVTLPSGVAYFDALTPAALDSIDVVVDFSSPDAFERSVDLACDANIPIVSGVTGLPDERMALLRQRVVDSGNRMVWAPNFSPGVAAFMQAAALLARTLSGYDAEVVEMHHRHKTDAPSGTATRLAHLVQQTAGKSGLVHGRAGASARGNEVGLHAVRAGDFFGEHWLLLAGSGEHIELRHSAHSRACFAQGALSAVRFIQRAAPSVYGMDDVLSAPSFSTFG